MQTLDKYQDALKDIEQAYTLIDYFSRHPLEPGIDILIWNIRNDLKDVVERLEEEIEIEELENEN